MLQSASRFCQSFSFLHQLTFCAEIQVQGHPLKKNKKIANLKRTNLFQKKDKDKETQYMTHTKSAL